MSAVTLAGQGLQGFEEKKRKRFFIVFSVLFGCVNYQFQKLEKVKEGLRFVLFSAFCVILATWYAKNPIPMRFFGCLCVGMLLCRCAFSALRNDSREPKKVIGMGFVAYSCWQKWEGRHWKEWKEMVVK